MAISPFAGMDGGYTTHVGTWKATYFVGHKHYDIST